MCPTSVSGIGAGECRVVLNYTVLSGSHYVGNVGWVPVTSIISLSKYSPIVRAIFRGTTPYSPVSQQSPHRLYRHNVGNVGWVSSSICSLVTHRPSLSISEKNLYNTSHPLSRGRTDNSIWPYTPLTSHIHDRFLGLSYST